MKKLGTPPYLETRSSASNYLQAEFCKPFTLTDTRERVNVWGLVPRLPPAALFPCTDTSVVPLFSEVASSVLLGTESKTHLVLNANHVLNPIMLMWDIWNFKTLICIHNRRIINISVYIVSLIAQDPKRTLQIISCRSYCSHNTKQLVHGHLKIPF